MNPPVAVQDAAGQLVAEHLRHRGIVAAGGAAEQAPASDRAAGGEPGRGEPALGLPGVTLDPAGGVAALGRRCRPQERRLADLLRAGTETGLYFADRPALEAAHGAGYDPVVYHAFRDFLPPRELSGGRCLPAGTPGYDRARGSGYLFADLIVYQPGTLPGGEPFRSTGHWNLSWQLEVFQTLSGRVLMLVAGRQSDGRPYLYEQACGPGEVMCVPFGVWHVSYVLDGPAAVFNVAADLSALAGARDPAVARQDPAKYCRAEPVAATVRRRGRGYDVVGSPAVRGWRERPGPRPGDWIAPFLAGVGSLAELHLFASPSELASLQREALRACGPAAAGPPGDR